MKIDAEQLLSQSDIVDVVGRHVHLKKSGGELKGICPFHDDTTSSLQVNPKKQIYKCFACGAGGDSIDFLMRLGRTFHEACDEIRDPMNTEARQLSPEKREANKPKPNSWKHVIPAPEYPTTYNHYRHGKPSHYWMYQDENGKPAGFVVRFDLPNGGKEVLPYVYATDGNRSEWRWMGFQKPRPLYNLPFILKRPNASVIVCEGEKTADAISAEVDLEKTIVTTWIGGANGIEFTDWTPLKGRKVIFWPDNDTEQKYGNSHPKKGEIKPWFEQPGNEAMLRIHDMIKSEVALAKWVNVPKIYPHKWDAADKEWKPGELREFVRTNMSEVPTVPPPEPPKQEEPKPQEPKPEKPKKEKLEGPKNPPPPPRIEVKEELPTNSIIDNPHFRMLGYDKDENSRLVYYFFSFGAKAVIKLSPTSMNKSNLMMLAPINWWEEMYPAAKAKIDIDAAQQFLIEFSHRVGTFKEKYIRGRGAWVDENRFIIHTGDMLIIDGQPTPLKNFRSRYVYEIGERLGFGMTQPLEAKDAYKLIEKAQWLLWERDINAYLIAGWCVIAPFCGVLPWRPHIWITGPAGSGKSWVMDNIVKRLLGETAVVVQGKTTEAGVRGLLQNDARAVLFDESDVDNNNDKERIQNILALARSSSYHDGGLIGKGTQTGSSRTYTMRSSFAFSSIGVQLNQQSDRSRFTMLGLMSFEHIRTKDDFDRFTIEWNNLITDDYVKALQSRTMSLLPVILKNSRVFADAVTHVIGQRRIGDQVGGMLAGAYSLSSSKEITYEEAIEWVKKRDWNEEKGLELTKDEYRLFGKLMGHVTRIESERGIIERTIGELILISQNLRTEMSLTSEAAANRLRRLGFMVKDQRILISNTADGISNIIKDTSWHNNYNKILERLPDAKKEEPRTYFPGIKSRGVSVPLRMVSEDAAQIPIEIPYSMAKNGEADDDYPF